MLIIERVTIEDEYTQLSVRISVPPGARIGDTRLTFPFTIPLVMDYPNISHVEGELAVRLPQDTMRKLMSTAPILGLWICKFVDKETLDYMSTTIHGVHYVMEEKGTDHV